MSIGRYSQCVMLINARFSEISDDDTNIDHINNKHQQRADEKINCRMPIIHSVLFFSASIFLREIFVFILS